MPIIARAIKKLHHDRKRTVVNSARINKMRSAVKTARKQPSVKTLQEAFSKLDKAVKTKTIHKNKAARIKSRLSKLIKAKKT